MSAAVSLQNVTVSYDRHPAVHHVSGTFAPGSLTAVTGPNGAGKSTLLKTIAGVLTPEEGEIRFENVPNNRIAYLPQAAEMRRNFPISVLAMVATGCWKQNGSFGKITREQKEKALTALQAVGLGGFEDRPIGKLSAGQFQRALFARVLMQDAPLILLDEPFTAIDADTTAKLMEMVLRWHGEQRTIICVLHDLQQIRQYFPQCLLLARQCIAWDTSERALHPEKLMNARFFHEAWDAHTHACEQ